MGRTSSARERLIQKGAELLWDQSYGAVGVDALCQAAGVKRGSFYHFFDSKDDLVVAILEEQWAAARARFDEAFRPDLPPAARVQRLYRALAETYRERQTRCGHVAGCPFGNIGAELATSNETIRAKVDAIFRRCAAYFADALRDACAQGLLALDEAEIAHRADMLQAYLEGVLLLAKTENDPEVISRLAPGALALFWGAGSGAAREARA